MLAGSGTIIDESDGAPTALELPSPAARSGFAAADADCDMSDCTPAMSFVVVSVSVIANARLMKT